MTARDTSSGQPPRDAVERLASVDRRQIWHHFTDEALYAEKAQFLAASARGFFVTDTEGREYFDASSGLWNVSLGYSRRELVDAVRAQLETLPFYHMFSASHLPAARLAERLLATLGAHFGGVLFAGSGSESVDSALKLARHYHRMRGTGRWKILYLEGAYHGSTMGAGSICGMPEEQAFYQPLVPGCTLVPRPTAIWNDGEAEPAALEAYLAELEACFARDAEIACVVVEPIQGTGGVRIPPPEVLRRLRALCTAHDALLILDEVATGFCRTGKLFAYEHTGALPDLLCLGKGMTSGYQPLAGLAISSALVDSFRAGGADAVFLNGFTTGGHPAACACALAGLEIMLREGLAENALRQGHELQRRLRALLPDGAVRGRGLMIGCSLPDDLRQRLEELGTYEYRVQRAFQEAGLLVRIESKQVILMPPLGISGDDVALIATRTEQALNELRALSSQDNHP